MLGLLSANVETLVTLENFEQKMGRLSTKIGTLVMPRIKALVCKSWNAYHTFAHWNTCWLNRVSRLHI